MGNYIFDDNMLYVSNYKTICCFTLEEQQYLRDPCICLLIFEINEIGQQRIH